jgi:hypothetical protein
MSTKRKVPIRYTSRDFDSIREDLVQYAKRYYPDTFKDFSEASFGSLMIDTVAYVGDMLSFYVDYQANESFLDSAVEPNNIIRLAREHGYKFKGPAAAVGDVTFYSLVPANSTGLGPDVRYLPILKKGTMLASTAGGSYILTQDVRFDNPKNFIIAARTNPTTGIPTEYAVKSKGPVISGKYETKSFSIGSFQKFRKVTIDDSRVVEIISVIDSEGHEYHEVEYLSHDVIYKSVPNKDSNTRDNAPSLMRPFTAPRRFITERKDGRVILQFGQGSDSLLATPKLSEPSNVVLQRFGKSYVTDSSFDPSDLTGTDKLGIGPANTTLLITYRRNTANSANAAVGAIKKITTAKVEFNDMSISNNTTAASVIRSIECGNEEPINGSIGSPTVEEIRRRTIDFFPTQNRAVTAADYEALAYAMPSEFGAIKRCRIVRDQDSLKRNLNMYVLAEATDGSLTTANSALKQNLKEWLNRYRMINDTIDILDGKVVNLGIEFTILSDNDVNRYDVLSQALQDIRDKAVRSMFIGERFMITDVYKVLNATRGVADVISVKMTNKRGGRYTQSGMDIDAFLSTDGRYLSCPDNVAFEIKYPLSDIKGTVK